MSSPSWPPTAAAITWTQLSALCAAIGVMGAAIWYVPHAIAEESTRVRKEAAEMIVRERQEARREFASRTDVAVVRAQLDEVLRLLRKQEKD